MTAKMGPLLGDMEPIVLKIGCNCSVAYRYVLFSSKTACVSAYMVRRNFLSISNFVIFLRHSPFLVFFKKLSTAIKTWNWQRMCFASVKCYFKAEISAQSLSVIVTLVTETSLFFPYERYLLSHYKNSFKFMYYIGKYFHTCRNGFRLLFLKEKQCYWLFRALVVLYE
ncbi:Uncharacterized protein APZ42_034601 [Daphnia magna]|uniref:Uncharacterized protein n=1 Tax=Daphnia magna TaxID=35525 RepID=A0A164K058_9CRUS|nr:Uncharacterized protein APZ42_034601 [Daphnia magna]